MINVAALVQDVFAQARSSEPDAAPPTAPSTGTSPTVRPGA